jgi:Serine/threonine protein kinase
MNFDHPTSQNGIDMLMNDSRSLSDLELDTKASHEGSLCEYGDLIILDSISETKCRIFKMISIKTQQVYALKLFDAADENLMLHYLSESRFSEVNHPNIVRIEDSKKYLDLLALENEMNVRALVLEYCPNGDFYELVCERGPKLPEVIVRTYFHQILSAIEYLHAHQIAHLDIKLENILLDENYQAKLCDFDSARFFDEEIELKGTPYYRAPELKEGKCVNPAAADIYSLGIVLFLMISGGIHPHLEEDNLDDGTNLYSLLNKNQNKFWKKQNEMCESMKNKDPFSEDFKKLFMSMIEPNPEKRATLQDIKNSEWFNSEVLSSSQMTTIMQSLF